MANITVSNIGKKWAAALAAALLSSSAFAADAVIDSRFEDLPPEEPTYDTVIYWSGDYANSDTNDYGVNAGFVTALNGDLGVSGFTVSGNLGFSYTDGSGTDSESYYGSLLLGYLWALPDFYISIGAGPNIINSDSDPASTSDGWDVGAIVQYGVETTRENSLYFQSYGSYSTVRDQVYLHAKTGYKASTLRFGPEFTYFDDNDSEQTIRYGAFVGDIPLSDRLSMVVSAGYEDENGGSDGFYATVGFAVPLSLRD